MRNKCTVVISALLLLASMVTAGAQGGPLFGGTLVLGTTTDATTLNPAIDMTSQNHVLSGQMFNTLVNFNFETMKMEGDLATSWNISSDGLMYTFHLNPDAKWQDGVPLTSADVKFSIEEAIVPYNQYGPTDWKGLQSVETPDNYTVVVKFSTYNSIFWQRALTKRSGSIIPKHLYEGTDIRTNPYNSAPVGSGPFKFVEWVKGDHITMERWNDYWKKDKDGNQLPYLDRIIVRVIPSTTTLELAFEKGEINAWLGSSPAFPEKYVAKYQNLTGFEVQADPEMGSRLGLHIIIYPNLRKAPFNDLKFRQGIACALDKDDWIEYAMFNLGKRMDSFVPNTKMMAFWYNPNIPVYEHNLTKANEILDEAGYARDADGVRMKTSIWVDVGAEDCQKIVELMRDQLSGVGIAVEIKRATLATILDYVFNRADFDMTIFYMTGGPEPASPAYFKYHSSSIGKGVWLNPAGYNNSRVDYLLDKAITEPNLDQRKVLLDEAQVIIAQELPGFFAVARISTACWNKNYVIPTRGLPDGLELLEKAYWTKGTPTGTTTPTSSPPYELYVGAAIALIAAVILITAAYRYRRRKAK